MFNVLKLINYRLSFIVIGGCLMGFWIICVLMCISQHEQPCHFPRANILVSLSNTLKLNCPAVNKTNLLHWILSNVRHTSNTIAGCIFQRSRFFCFRTVHPIRWFPLANLFKKRVSFFGVRSIRLCVPSFNWSDALLIEYSSNKADNSILLHEVPC